MCALCEAIQTCQSVTVLCLKTPNRGEDKDFLGAPAAAPSYDWIQICNDDEREESGGIFDTGRRHECRMRKAGDEDRSVTDKPGA